MDFKSPDAFCALAMTVFASCAMTFPHRNATQIATAAIFFTTATPPLRQSKRLFRRSQLIPRRIPYHEMPVALTEFGKRIGAQPAFGHGLYAALRLETPPERPRLHRSDALRREPSISERIHDDRQPVSKRLVGRRQN